MTWDVEFYINLKNKILCISIMNHDARVTQISDSPFKRIVNKRFKLLEHHDRYKIVITLLV
jgi:hypothetical protein